MLTPEQVALRATGIGASEIAAIVGLSPYATAMDVWLQKIGAVEGKPDTPYMAWGRKLESVIAEQYAATCGVELLESTTLRHPEHEWMLATPDRILADRSKLVEIKNVSAARSGEWGEPGMSEVPERYYLQVLWQMAVTGIDRADVAALVGGNDFRIYRVARDLRMEAWLIEIGRQFWFDHVVAEEAPPADDQETIARYLSIRYPRDSGQTVEATPEIEIWIDRLREAREAIEEAEALRLEAENRIKAYMGDAATLVSRYGTITFKATRDIKFVDWKAAATAARLPDTLIDQHTTFKPGVRRFLPKFEG